MNPTEGGWMIESSHWRTSHFHLEPQRVQTNELWKAESWSSQCGPEVGPLTTTWCSLPIKHLYLSSYILDFDYLVFKDYRCIASYSLELVNVVLVQHWRVITHAHTHTRTFPLTNENLTVGFWENCRPVFYLLRSSCQLFSVCGVCATCVCVQVFPDKRSLKLLKSQSINVNWYQYCPETAVMLLSTTVQGNVLQPFAFRVSSCLFTRYFLYLFHRGEIEINYSSTVDTENRECLHLKQCFQQRQQIPPLQMMTLCYCATKFSVYWVCTEV